jgi:uncharacterized coiled-coil DUF342 family protein
MTIVTFRVSCYYPSDQNITNDKARELRDKLNQTVFDESVTLMNVNPQEKKGNENRIKVMFRPMQKTPLNETAIVEKVEGVIKQYVTNVHSITGHTMKD